VSLTGLAWSVVDEGSDSVFATVDSVFIRDHYWGEDSSQYKTLVELSGQVVNQNNLRQKQNKLDDFLAVLSHSDNVDGLQVIESPAKSAGSSHSISESAGVFKILFSINSI
jgi:hypothetical protein